MNTLTLSLRRSERFAVWLRSLTSGQIEDVAKIMTAWRIKENEILPIYEVEQREVIRAITVCGGDVLKAAEAL